MTHPGFATPEGTQHYFSRFENPTQRPLGKTGLRTSSIGFGGYRVHDRVHENREALRLALLSGCNLIDTSSNYGNGGSEILIGQVLRELFEAGKLQRQEVILVTKAGYLQGDNLQIAQEKAENGDPFPEVVEYSPDCWHCISPEFLDDQITRSAARLQLETLDFLLLHNPEYFLKGGGSPQAYYARICQAFEYLETQVATGRIRGYGISSNTFPAAKDDPEATSLEAVLELAQKISVNHHFQIIQFPFNLYEPGAALEENCAGTDLLTFAHQNGLGTLANRPLNAFAHRKLFRLADFPPHDPGRATEALQKALTATLEMESRYPARELFPARAIAWGHIIRQNFERISDIESWKNLLQWQIRPALAEAASVFGPALQSDSRDQDQPPAYLVAAQWLRDYVPVAEKLFNAMTQLLEAQAAQDSWRLTELLLAEAPELTSTPQLSRKALRLYQSIASLDCILVGMRTPTYVRDAVTPLLPIPESKARQALLAVQQSLSLE